MESITVLQDNTHYEALKERWLKHAYVLEFILGTDSKLVWDASRDQIETHRKLVPAVVNTASHTCGARLALSGREGG